MKRFRKLCCAALAAGLMLPQVVAIGSEAATGTWKKSSKGWWYSYSDGSYAANEWVKDGGKWYYFDDYGYMFTGWISENGKWYYLGKNGAMVNGWKKISGEWYYFKGGAMQTGWKKIGGQWYVFDYKDGYMITGWYSEDDDFYYLDEIGGFMVTGEVEIEGVAYTFDDNGVLVDPGPEVIESGSWTDPMADMFTKHELEVFDKATSGMAGASYEPLACLGSQVVAGVNHRFLCKETLIVNPPFTQYAIVTIYEDLEGNCRITDIDISNAEVTEEGLAGGFTTPVSIFLSSNDKVIDDALKAFDAATTALEGVDYKALAVLGTQVVAGTNYRILAYAKVVSPEAQGYFTILTVNQPLEGDASIIEFDDFSDAPELAEE